MSSTKKDKKGNLAGIESLAASGKTQANFLRDFVNRELATVLMERKLKKVETKTAIVSHLETGLVISGPVSVPDNMASSDLRKKPLPVGFLINTMRLIDPVSRRALKPGVTLVERRSLGHGEFAFDYIGGDGKVKMATDTHRYPHFGGRSDLSDPGGRPPQAGRRYDIEVNHVLKIHTIDDLLPSPCAMVCTSYHDGTEKCHYACSSDGEDDLGFTIAE